VIAFYLGISPRTVEIYRANLMTKMSANSLSDSVRMAMVCGILDSSYGACAPLPSRQCDGRVAPRQARRGNAWRRVTGW